jgi:hypothetical protein
MECCHVIERKKIIKNVDSSSRSLSFGEVVEKVEAIVFLTEEDFEID